MKNSEIKQDDIKFLPNTSTLLKARSIYQSPSYETDMTGSGPSFLLTSSTPSTLQVLKTTNGNKKSLNQIQQIYSQIHNTINDMDSKVQHVIKKHQAQFLFAYRTHIKKIKKQLAQIKHKSQQQQKMFSSNDRIQYLQKQLAIFRQQTMKLYKKLDQKNLQIDILKNKLKQLEKQTQYQTNQLKQQFRKNKFQEMNKILFNQKLNTFQKQIQQKNSIIQKLQSQLSNYSNQHKSISSSAMKSLTHEHLKKSDISRTSIIHEHRRSSITHKQKGPSSLSTTAQFYSNKLNQSQRIYDTDLKQWFLECIKTVKKQVAQRNNTQKNLNLQNISSLQDFMMIDKLKLLQIFLQNQKLLTWMYERIFPDRLIGLRDKLNNSKLNNQNNHNLLISSQKEISTQRDQRSMSINQEILNQRYNAYTKIYLPKVNRGQDIKQKLLINEKNINLNNHNNQWKSNLTVKQGKLNVSIN